MCESALRFLTLDLLGGSCGLEDQLARLCVIASDVKSDFSALFGPQQGFIGLVTLWALGHGDLEFGAGPWVQLLLFISGAKENLAHPPVCEG